MIHCKIAECGFEQFPRLPLPQTGVHQHLGGRPWRCVLQRPSPGHTRQRHNQGTLHSVSAWSLIFLKFTLNPIFLSHALYYCYMTIVLIRYNTARVFECNLAPQKIHMEDHIHIQIRKCYALYLSLCYEINEINVIYVVVCAWIFLGSGEKPDVWAKQELLRGSQQLQEHHGILPTCRCGFI